MVMMVMVVVMMVLLPVSERRTCERHQQQSCRKYSLHGSNPSMVSIACGGASSVHVSNQQRYELRGVRTCFCT